jgi:tetratricopeptide (TPR) repeat protein
MSMGPPGEQLALLESLYAQDPGGRIFLRLGQAYLDADRPADAARVLEQGLAWHPDELAGRQTLAQAWLALGQRDKALDELLRADQALCRLAGVYKMLAELLPTVGRAAEGLRAGLLARGLSAAPEAAADQAEPAEGAAPARPLPPTETATLAEIYAAQGLDEEARAIYRRLGRSPEAETAAPRSLSVGRTKPAMAGPERATVLNRLMALRDAALARVV